MRCRRRGADRRAGGMRGGLWAGGHPCHDTDSKFTPASPTATPIGDGSTSDTGPQPNQPVPPDLPSRVAPPHSSSSVGTAAATDAALLTRFRAVGRGKSARV